jgi:serralysin
LPDSVGDSVGTAGTINVGTVITGAIETIGDQDWYRVQLVAGTHYYINLTGDKTGDLWVEYPEIRVLDSTGALVVVSSDRDFRDSAFIDFVPLTDGEYFISAGDDGVGSFILSADVDIPESIATNALLQEVFSSTGFISADAGFDDNWYRVEVPNYYEGQMFVVEVTDAGIGNSLSPGSTYLQLFDADGQLIATGGDTISLAMLEAGTYFVSVGGTTAMTDGYYDIGISVFGDEVWETPVKALDWRADDFADNSNGEPREFRVFFALGGKTVDDGRGAFTSSTWTESERAAAMTAFAAFEAVANLKFTVVTSITSADFVMVKNPGTANTGIEENLGYWNIGPRYLRYGSTDYIVQGSGIFNSTDASWTAAGLKPGGYGYITLIHEIGHALGLKHPHDTGGQGSLMEGVTQNDPEDRGSYSLNQGIYTMMSYNDGWETQPGVGVNTSLTGGWEATPMALDIAQLQLKHGAAQNATGNNTYTLLGSNAAGIGFKAIWDTGGTDTIRYTGSKNAFVSLQQATLDYSKSGGGVVSYVEGVRGGFTIAYGAWIENATSGSGDDWLQGSLRANKLNGSAGRDTVDYSNRVRPIETKLAGATAAVVKVDGKAEDLLLNIENVIGGAAGDTIKGDSLGNWLTGGGGGDVLRGAGGSDRFVFTGKLNAGNVDTVLDFKHDRDTVALDDKFFKAIGSSLSSGEFWAKAGAKKAHDADDRIIYNSTTGNLYYDPDGRPGSKVAILFATLSNTPTLDHGDFLIV